MPRWKPGARERFEAVALDLFVTQGYEQTTVAAIAARAGLTERTFDRHFADKQEVLFGGGATLETLLAAEVAAAPATTPALQAVTLALMRVADEHFAGREPAVRKRQAVIDANPVLQERELQKRASLARSLERTLRTRGISARAASLTAEAGILVFQIAFTSWLEAGNTLPLSALIDQTRNDLRVIATEWDAS